MSDPDSISRFEVRCPDCDVSFPIETKRCVHCGARTRPGGPRRNSVEWMPAAAGKPASGSFGGGFGEQRDERFEQSKTASLADSPAALDSADEEQSAGARPSVLRGVATLVWVALAIGLSLARSCSG